MPGVVNKNPYMYFMISSDHINKENEIEHSIGHRFECGTVVVKGNRVSYSFKSTNMDFMKHYPDAKLVAEGYRNQMQFTECTNPLRGGN